ncbi:MAG TPA: type I 3-dehydroquinate dehydratase, partial [Pyrinomonadaceae bacterium]|nr:type I 3-dehydroquinate dehydratase [Pyrinomonadaceae bacterium]
MTEGRARVCVPVCARRAGELKEAVERAAVDADIIELRLDCLDASELEAARPALAALLEAHERPLIFTLRPSEQGGRRDLDLSQRLSFRLDHWPTEGESNLSDFFDIELDLMPAREEDDERRRAFAAWLARNLERVVCSHHDFKGVPPNLPEIYERMTTSPARVLKIAYAAETATDCLPAFALLERARREGRELIAIAMGDAGLLTRVLAPSRGAFLTFGASDAASATAPGQVTAADLRDLYRIDSVDEQTQLTGLVGSPVMHSLSPHVHNAAFNALGLNFVYVPLEVRDLDAFMRRMARPDTRELDWPLRGLSVTAPHKRAVIQYLDSLEPSARDIGAVNTVVLEGDRLRGHNT